MELAVKKISGDHTELKKLTKKLESLTAGKIAHEVKVKYLDRNFDRSLNIDGSPMAPLKPSTIIAKRKLGGKSPSKPLIFTGQLSESTVQQDEGNKKSTLTVYDNHFGGITNTEILDIAKKKNRIPWGWAEPGIKIARAFVEKFLGGKLG